MNDPQLPAELQGKPIEAAEPSAADAEIMQQKVQETQVLIQLQVLNARKHRAYLRGVDARQRRLFRTSPYYEDPGSDVAWFAGFDGDPEPTIDTILVPVLGETDAQRPAIISKEERHVTKE